jgi:hypothetical protein
VQRAMADELIRLSWKSVALRGRMLNAEYGTAGNNHGQYVAMQLSGYVDSESKLHIHLATCIRDFTKTN